METAEKENVQADATQATTEPTPTQKEDVETLKAELAKTKALAEEKEKGFKTLQREIAKLKRQPQTEQSPVTKSIVNELDNLSKSTYSDDPAAQARISVLKNQLADEERKALVSRQQAQIDTKREELYDQLREAGLDPTDESITADLENALDDEMWMGDGSFKRADRQLKKILKNVKPSEVKEKVDTKKPETEAQLRERIEREVLEKHGLLKPEKANPSSVHGRTWSREEIRNMSPEDYVQNRKDIEEARQAGRIK